MVEEVKRTYVDGCMDRITEEHPCFGAINISRVSGSANLFGSVTNNSQHFIRLTISTATLSHSFGQDHVYSDRGIVEVHMTEAQFANMITSWNMGEGTPVTLARMRNGDKYECVPSLPSNAAKEAERAQDHFKHDMEKRMERVSSEMEEARKILAKKGAINKGDREKLGSAFSSVERWFKDAAPYSVHTFIESTERTMQKAKLEIDAFVTSIINRTGLNALKTMKLKAGDKGIDAKELEGKKSDD